MTTEQIQNLTSTVCIQDKNGKHWNTICSTQFVGSEIRNMKRHIASAIKNPKAYAFLDLETAQLLVNGIPYKETLLNSDFDLLKELGI